MRSELSPADLLRTRLRVVADNLERGATALESLDADAALPAEVRGPLADLLSEQVAEAERLDRRLTGSPSDDDWRRARGFQKDANDPLLETLGCIQAAHLRSLGLDGGLCALADRLLRSIEADTPVTWLGTTIVGGAERFAPRTHLVHVRFPEFTVWVLPLAAHEFGHLVAQELKVRSPSGVQVFEVDQELSETEDPILYGELFGDAFATWTLGPAYACTAILQRFAPDRAAADSRTHPSDAKRVEMTLGLLEQMSTELDSTARPYHGVASMLRRTWRRSLTEAGVDGLDAAGDDELRVWRTKVIVPLLKLRLRRALYDGWGEALAVRDMLARVRPGPAQPDGPRIADVLNGAWLARIDCWEDKARVADIEKRARHLCSGAAGGTA
jgi:hypothetical protein